MANSWKARGPNLERRGVGGAVVVLLVTVTILASIGCGTSNPYQLGSLERARHWAEHDQYQEAADAFEIFVRQNPADTLAAQAQYEKSLAYMQLKEYPLAAVELQILVQDYPDSPLVEAAVFREGECYWRQVGRLERDVTPAYEARLHWLDFSRRFPGSKFQPEIDVHMQEIADLMVSKQLRAVRIYQQLRRHDAVALVLDRILDDEPTSSILDQVLWERGKVATRLEDPETARRTYQRLLDEYPQSEFRSDAERALGELPAPVAASDATP